MLEVHSYTCTQIRKQESHVDARMFKILLGGTLENASNFERPGNY